MFYKVRKIIVNNRTTNFTREKYTHRKDKENNMKKIVSIFLTTIFMTIGLIPVVGHAETSEKSANNSSAKYEIVEDSVNYTDDFFYEEKIIEREKDESKRFIIKYKNNSQKDKKYLKALAKQTFQELKKEKDKELAELETALSEYALEKLKSEQKSNKVKSVFAPTVSTNAIVVASPQYEVIELEDSINKEQFISQIEDAMGDAIEYIQPDVEMEISNVDTTEIVKAVTDKNGNMSQANNISTGEGVTVALIDTGVDITHSALQDNMVTGWDFFNNTELTYSAETSSDSMHGTHVAGIISQVAPNSKIIPLKVFENGKAYTSDIIKAIEYAEEKGADIVNCSWGNSSENPALKEAMENSNMFFVAAAGNNRMNLDETPVYPASYGLDNIISVASVNQDGGMSYFSNYGESVDIAAWGRDVYSTIPNNEYGNMNGTSMSAGYITGAAALAVANGANIKELKFMLKSSADKVSTLENKVNDKNIVDFANIVYGIAPQETTYINAEDDFDRWKEKSPDENWKLFANSENIQAATGGGHNLVLKADGTVWTWGRNTHGQLGDGTLVSKNYPVQVIGLTNVKSVTAGSISSMILKTDGTVWTWGGNTNGQLGTSGSGDILIPTQVTFLSEIKKISCNYNHALALREDGNVFAWGSNVYKQLGTSSGSSTRQVMNLTNIIDIDTSLYNSIALKADGTVWTWGSSDSGVLGRAYSYSSDYVTPKQIPGLTNIKSIAMGGSHALALSNDGQLWGWGSNYQQQLTNVLTAEKIYTPVQIPYFTDISEIFAGPSRNIVLKADGTMWIWGGLGFGHKHNWAGSYTIQKTPIQMEDVYKNEYLQNVLSVCMGSQNIIVIKTNGTILIWGANDYGQLCDGKIAEAEQPYLVSSIDGIKKIASGTEHNLALKEDGTVWSWGRNYFGELGVNYLFDSATPQQVLVNFSQNEPLSDVKDIGAYYSNSIALKEDGTVWMWGSNSSGRLGNGETTSSDSYIPKQVKGENGIGYLTNVKSISVGQYFVLALQEDGTLLKWGNGAYTPVKIDELDNIREISAGSDHWIALSEDGNVFACGSNTRGQLSDSCDGKSSNNEVIQISSLANIKEIETLGSTNMVLREDGTVWTWGYNYYGDLGDGTTEDNATPRQVTGIPKIKHIASSDNKFYVIAEDGTVWSWGDRYGYISKGLQPVEATSLLSIKSNNIQSISGGSNHELILTQDGRVWTIGYNDKGQLGDCSNITNNTPLFLKYDGFCFEVSIISVSTNPSSIEVPYGTPAEELDAMLPTQARVYFDNGGYDDLPITSWDKSEYISDVPGEYTIYGTLELTDGIINPLGKKAEVKVNVQPRIPQTIEDIPPIPITADQSVPLEKEGLGHSLGEPVTVPVPETVEAELDNGETVELDVIWDIDSYNPHQTGEQTIYGEVVLKNGIGNPNGLTARLDITVMPAEYWIIDSNPQTISIDVLAGTTKDEILKKIEPKIIDVDVMNAETGDELYIYTGFTFSDEYTENTLYNPNQLGKQTLIGRFYDNFLDETTVPPCVEVEVNVVSSVIVSVPEKHVNAYQCAAFDTIENLPQKVTVNLENGMTAEVDVDWHSDTYERGIAGDQIITGELVNLPEGVIQPEEEKIATLIVHVLPVSYKITAVTPDEDYFETDKDGNTLYAGFTLSELRSKLPVDKVKVQLESVTEEIEFTTDYELDFTLEEENNPDYVSEEEYFDYLYGTLVLPENISNPNNEMYEFTVFTCAVEIEGIEPVSVIVDYYTEFDDIDIPDTYVKLSNGQRRKIGVDWGTGEEYNPDPEDLTEDHPVEFNLTGTLCDVPPYINHYDDIDIPQLTITLVLPKVYKITDISPARIPETGTKKINLGSSIDDIDKLIESHTATITLENLKGVTSTQDVTFTLREEDNGHYDAMSEEEFELIANLNLPEGIENPYNKQLVISVRPSKYTIKTAVVSKVNGVVAGTPFEEIEMPNKVMVNYTDTVTKQGEVPVASWDGSKYDKDKIGNQPIKGTFPDPLPVYVTNPNNRTPSALINVVDPTTTILSAKQVTGAVPFSPLRRGIKQVIAQTEEIEGYIERKYEVELLHEDGSITTEIISIFDEVEEN